MMAAELKVQELEQKAQSQITDQESEKKAVNVVVNLVPPTNNPSGENNHQPLTKTELKEPAPIAEKPPIKPSKKTPSERERDRKNAKRRARYQLKKMLASPLMFSTSLLPGFSPPLAFLLKKYFPWQIACFGVF